MSCDKWAYDPEKCDDTFCCGDCDLCAKVSMGDMDAEVPEREEQTDAL